MAAGPAVDVLSSVTSDSASVATSPGLDRAENLGLRVQRLGDNPVIDAATERRATALNCDFDDTELADEKREVPRFFRNSRNGLYGDTPHYVVSAVDLFSGEMLGFVALLAPLLVGDLHYSTEGVPVERMGRAAPENVRKDDKTPELRVLHMQLLCVSSLKRGAGIGTTMVAWALRLMADGALDAFGRLDGVAQLYTYDIHLEQTITTRTLRSAAKHLNEGQALKKALERFAVIDEQTMYRLWFVGHGWVRATIPYHGNRKRNLRMEEVFFQAMAREFPEYHASNLLPDGSWPGTAANTRALFA